MRLTASNNLIDLQVEIINKFKENLINPIKLKSQNFAGGNMEFSERKKELVNPLSDLISDEIYEILESRGLINERSVRDYRIRKKFKMLRAQKVRTGDAIDALREEYPYLQFDTIRKIVHNPPKSISAQDA